MKPRNWGSLVYSYWLWVPLLVICLLYLVALSLHVFLPDDWKNNYLPFLSIFYWLEDWVILISLIDLIGLCTSFLRLHGLRDYGIESSGYLLENDPPPTTHPAARIKPEQPVNREVKTVPRFLQTDTAPPPSFAEVVTATDEEGKEAEGVGVPQPLNTPINPLNQSAPDLTFLTFPFLALPAPQFTEPSVSLFTPLRRERAIRILALAELGTASDTTIFLLPSHETLRQMIIKIITDLFISRAVNLIIVPMPLSLTPGWKEKKRNKPVKRTITSRRQRGAQHLLARARNGARGQQIFCLPEITLTRMQFEIARLELAEVLLSVIQFRLLSVLNTAETSSRTAEPQSVNGERTQNRYTSPPPRPLRQTRAVTAASIPTRPPVTPGPSRTPASAQAVGNPRSSGSKEIYQRVDLNEPPVGSNDVALINALPDSRLALTTKIPNGSHGKPENGRKNGDAGKSTTNGTGTSSHPGQLMENINVRNPFGAIGWPLRLILIGVVVLSLALLTWKPLIKPWLRPYWHKARHWTERSTSDSPKRPAVQISLDKGTALIVSDKKRQRVFMPGDSVPNLDGKKFSVLKTEFSDALPIQRPGHHPGTAHTSVSLTGAGVKHFYLAKDTTNLSANVMNAARQVINEMINEGREFSAGENPLLIDSLMAIRANFIPEGAQAVAKAEASAEVTIKHEGTKTDASKTTKRKVKSTAPQAKPKLPFEPNAQRTRVK